LLRQTGPLAISRQADADMGCMCSSDKAVAVKEAAPVKHDVLITYCGG
jgi:hypothetical protein